MSLESLETRLAPATFTWTGGAVATNTFWTTGANWQGGVAPTGNPANNDILNFPAAAAKYTTNNNITFNGGNPTFKSITIASGATPYLLQGNPVILGSSGDVLISNGPVGSSNTIELQIQLTGPTGQKQFFQVGNGNTLNITGSISGSTGSTLSTDGVGTLVLAGNNSSFTGTIDIGTGIVRITHANALGSFGGVSDYTVVRTNAQLQVQNVAGTINEFLILNGPGINNDGAVLNVAGNNVWAGDVQVDSNVSMGASGTPATSSLDIQGLVFDTGAGHDITKVGPGKIIFGHSGGNTYRGLTTVKNGVLTIRDPLSLGPAVGTLATATLVTSDFVGSGTLQVEFINTLQLVPGDPNGNLLDPTLPYDVITNPYIGFTVPNEVITINGPGSGGLGALDNRSGSNTWNAHVIVSSPNPNGVNAAIGAESTVVSGVDILSTLTVNGKVIDQRDLVTEGLAGAVPPTAGIFDLTKVGPGRVVFTNSNLYRGFTTVAAGYLRIQDSQSLGQRSDPLNQGNSVGSGGTLELAIDGIPDSFTGTTHTLGISEPSLSLAGLGARSTEGALYNISGINIWENNVTVSDAGVGVELDPNPKPDASYFDNDYKLTLTGVVSGSSLSKLRNGMLVLTNTNTYTGFTNIVEGWITVTNSRALGGLTPFIAETQQNPTVVSAGASLHLMAPTGSVVDATNASPIIITAPGHGLVSGDSVTISDVTGNTAANGTFIVTVNDPYTFSLNGSTGNGAYLGGGFWFAARNLTMAENMELAGSGISHPFPYISGKGALLNLRGNNLLGDDKRVGGVNSSYLILDTDSGIGVESIYGYVTSVAVTGGGSGYTSAPAVSFGGGGTGAIATAVLGSGATAGQVVAINIVSQGSGYTTVPTVTLSGGGFTTPATATASIRGATSELSLTATMTNLQGPRVQNYNFQANGGQVEQAFPINTGGTSGTITLTYDMLFEPDQLRIYAPTRAQGATTPIYDSGLVSGVAPVSVTYNSPTGWVELVMNEGNNLSSTTIWYLNNVQITPDAFPIPPGGIIKYGSNRLNLQGAGTYTGAVTINDGALRAQNDTAFGDASGGVTVAGGVLTAVSITNVGSGYTSVPTVNFDNTGTGGSGAAGTALVVNEAVIAVILTNPGSGYTSPPTVSFSGGGGSGASAVAIANNGTLELAAGNPMTLGGFNSIGTGGERAGTQVWGERLTLNGPGSNSLQEATLVSMDYVDLFGNSLAGDNMWRGPATFGTNVNVDVHAGTRLNLFGAIDEPANVNAGLTVTSTTNVPLGPVGTGELVLNGSNSYEGATLINSGIVTLTNGQGLGSAVGGTTVAAGAQLQLQGNLTVAGESLTVLGSGRGAIPTTVPVRWLPLGPAPATNGQTIGNENVSGRITGVAVDHTDSNVIYIVTAGGGAWKTFDGGVHWHPLIDTAFDAVTGTQMPIQGLFMGSIMIDPYDPRILYVGTGEANNSIDAFYGRGLLKSIDSGLTWTLDRGPEVPAPGSGVFAFDGKVIGKIVFDPLIPGMLYMLVNGQTGGAVARVNVTSGGAGYALPPAVTFVGGGGTGATARAIMAGGQVVSVAVLTAGSGYTSPPIVVFTGGGGTGASATVNITGANYTNGTPGRSALYRFDPRRVPGNQWRDMTTGDTSILPPVGVADIRDPQGNDGDITLGGFYQYTDFSVEVDPRATMGQVDPSEPDLRIFFLAVGGSAGVEWQAVQGAPNPSPNGIYTGYKDFGTGRFQWNLFGFPTADTFGVSPNVYTHAGIVNKVASATMTPQLSTGNFVITVEGYATVTFPTGYPGALDSSAADNAFFELWRISMVFDFTAGSFPTSNGPQWSVQATVPLTGSATVPIPGGQRYLGTQGNYDHVLALDASAVSAANPLPNDQNGRGIRLYMFGVGQSDPPTPTPGPFYSDDGGLTWLDFGGPDSNGVAPHIDYHSFGFDNHGLAQGQFFGTSIPGTRGMFTSPGVASGNHRLLVGNDGGLWRLENINVATRDSTTGIATGTWTWKNLNGNLAITQFNGISADPNDPGIGFGGTGNIKISGTGGTFKFNGSQAWTQVDINDGGQVHIDPQNPLTVYHVRDQQLYKSTDGGATWALAAASLQNFTNFSGNLYFPFLIDSINSTRLLVGADFFDPIINPTGIPLRESLNGGSTFINLNVPVPTFENVTALAAATYQGPFTADPGFPLVTDKGANTYDPDTIYVVDTADNIWVTKDHGVSWQNRNNLPGLGSADSVVSIAVDDSNRDVAYVVRNVFSGVNPGFAGRHVFKTNNAGRTWTDISGNIGAAGGLLDLPTWKVIVDPRDHSVYIGNDQGVYLLPDVPGGDGTDLAHNTWQRFGAGMPRVQVTDLELNQTLNTITAGTYGRSMFQLFLDPVQTAAVDSGALRAVSGTSVWTGPIVLSGPTTISAHGTNSLQSGVGSAGLNIVGVISESGANIATATATVALGAVTGTTITNAGSGYTGLGGAFVTFSGGGGSGAAGTVTVAGGVVTGITITNPGSGYTSAPSVTISSPFQLTKVGRGDVTLSAANTYLGVTDVREGNLIVHNPLALGASTAPTIVQGDLDSDGNGAALQLQTDLQLEPVFLNGDGIQFNGHFQGALRNVSNDNTYTGILTLVTDSTIGVDSGSSLTIGALGNGTVTDAAATRQLTKELTGTLILANANSYDGDTRVNQGALNLRNNLALGPTGAAQVLDGAQIQLQNNVSIANNLRLSGTGVFGTGALQNISGLNHWTGNVNFAKDPGLSNSPPVQPTVPPDFVALGALPSGGTDALFIDGVIDQVFLPVQLGLLKVGNGVVVLNNDNPYLGLTTIQAGTLRITKSQSLGGAAGQGTIVNSGTVLEIDGGGAGVTINASEVLTLNAATTPNSAALLHNISGTNTWAGRVILQNLATVGSTNDRIIANSGTQLTMSGVIQDGPDFVSSVAMATGGSNYTAAPTVTFSAPTAGGVLATGVASVVGGVVTGVTITNPGSGYTAPPTVSFTFGGGSGAVAFASTLSGTATTLLVGSSPGGDGKVIFSGANSYTGTTFVNGGILNIQNATALGLAGPEVQTVTVVATGGQFRLSFTDGGVTNTTAFLPFNVSASGLEAALNGLANIGAGGVSVTKTGNVYSVRFIGANLIGRNLTPMTAQAQFGPTVTINTRADGTGSTTVLSGATLQLQGGIVVAGETLTISGTGFNNIGALDNAAGNNTWGKTITLAGDASIGGSVPGDRLTLNTPITDKLLGVNQGFAITKFGPGILQYSGAASNDYTGLTNVVDGILELNMAATFTAILGNLVIGNNIGLPDSASVQLLGSNQIADASNININSDGIFDLNGLAETITNLVIVDGDVTTGAAGAALTISSLDMTGGAITLGAGTQLNLNGNATVTSDATESALISGAGSVMLTTTRTFTVNEGAQIGDLIISAPVAGAGGLTKDGPGRLVFAPPGASTYSGVTTISAGDLQVDGSITSNVALNGGSLSGVGTVGTITGSGTVSPGDNSNPVTTGILNSATATWGAGTIFAVGLSASVHPNPVVGADYDRLAVTGSINLGGAALTGVANPNILINDVFTIITSTAGVSGTFAGIADLGSVFISGQKFTVDYTATSVILTRVPVITTTVVTSSSNPSVYGQPLTFTAQVTPEPGGGAIPVTDTITFQLDAFPAVVKNVDATGQATLTVPGDIVTVLGIGGHNLTATYSGSAQFFGSVNSPVFVQTVTKANTSINVSTAPASPFFGQGVTVNVTVAPLSPATGTPSSNVTISVDGGAGVVVALNGAGQASLGPISGLSAGNHSIDVSYAGDTNFNANATTYNFTVQKDTVNVAVSSSASSTVYSESVTFTATVTATNSGTPGPTGTVSFFDGPIGGLLLGTATLDALGVASVSVDILSVGAHSINVSYSGDVNYQTGAGSRPHTVIPISTSTVVSSSVTPSTFGQAVVFSATVTPVAPGGGVPNGTVTFTIDGAPAGISGLNASGVASITTVTMGVGAHNVVATYNGATLYAGSISPVFVQQVTGASTTTLTSNANPSVFGQVVTFTAQVKGPTGSTLPTGTVTFVIDGTNQVPNVPLDAAGRASLSDATLTIGAHTIQAFYNGDTNYAVSSANLTQTVNKVNTTTALASSDAPSVFGDAVDFTATVSPVAPGGGIPDGSVTFFVDGISQTTVPLDPAGQAVFTATALLVGSHSIKASYSGSGDFVLSNGFFTQIVQKVGSTTTVTASSDPSFLREPVVFTATVTPVAGLAVPTGRVQFFVNGVLRATRTLDTSGNASITLANIGLGTRNVTARYLGSATVGASISAPLPHSVLRPGTTPSVIAVSSSGSPTVFGEPVIFTVTVSSSFGTPTGRVTISVDGVRQAPVTLDASGQAFIVLNNMTVRVHNVIANYYGDTTFAASKTPTVLKHTVQRAITDTTLTSTVNASVVGEPVTFTADVAALLPSTGQPTGAVIFLVDNVRRGTAVLNASGQASVTLANLKLGTHQVVARYLGNSKYATSSSPILSQTVQPAGGVASTTTLDSSLNPSSLGQPVTFTATVPAGATGTITFVVDNVKKPPVVLSAGQASITLSNLAGGTRRITAVYYGDGTFAGSSSAPLFQVVGSTGPQPVRIAASIASINGSYTLTVAALNAAGQQIPSYSGAQADITLVSGPGSLNGPTSSTFFSGSAKFPGLNVTAAGTYTLRITSGSLSLFFSFVTSGRQL